MNRSQLRGAAHVRDGARLRIRVLSLFAAFVALSARAAEAPDVPAPGPIAQIGSTVIQAEELDPKTRADIDHLAVLHEQQQRQLETTYRVTRQQAWTDAAQKLLDQRLLALEARARHTTPDKLLAAVPFAAVTPEEERLVYDQHAKEINRPYETVQAQLLKEMTAQRRTAAERAYYRELMEKYHAMILVDPPRFQVAATGASTGAPNAPVTIILFSDFQCPYCARLVPVLNQVLAKYPADVRLVYRHLPLTTLHPNANDAAFASVCADRQGKFWPLYEALFADQRQLSPKAIKATTEKLGFDGKAYDECMASGEPRRIVGIDASMAEDLALTGTPVMFVNGRLVAGAQSFENLSTVIEEERVRARKAPAATEPEPATPPRS